MFNKDYKEKYLEDNKDVNLNLSRYMTNAFNNVERFEQLYNKDLYNFTLNEIIEYYKYLATPSFETLQVLNSQFKIYTKVALMNHLVKDNQNHYDEMTPDILITCVNKGLSNRAILTRNQIEKVADECLNSCDAFFLLALFEGIRGKEGVELIELYPENFDKAEMTVTLATGRTIPISSKLYDLAMESVNIYEYFTGVENLHNVEIVKNFDPKDTRILKTKVRKNGNPTLHNRFATLQKTYAKIREKSELEYTMNMVMESGRINLIQKYIKESELEPEECIRKYRSEIEYRYGKIQCIPTYLLKYGEFLLEK